MTEVILTRRALRDLHQIDQYSIDTFGQAVADQYMADLDRGVELLAEEPGLLRHDPDVAGRLRFYRVRAHYLVCDVMDGRVYLLAVIHTAMDLPGRLAELEPQLAQEVQVLHKHYQQAKKNKR